MGWTSAPSPPPAPDPAIQTANEAAANRYNINSPFGSQTWTQGPRDIIGYDSTGKPLYGSQYTQNITLNPSEQRQYDQRNEISELLMQQGKQGIEQGLPEYASLEANPGRPDSLTAPGAPGSFDPRAVNGDPRAPEFSLNDASSNAAKAHYDRISALLEPTFERDTNRWEQRMNNAGLPVGSEAYGDSLNQFKDSQNRQLADAAYEAAVRAPELALAERGQQMSDRGQYFDETLAGYGTDVTNRQQNMADRGQTFNEGLAVKADERTGYQQYQSERDRQFNEDLARRQQYFNEIAAALGGQQLNPINAGGGGGDSNLNVSGAFDTYNAANMNNYNQKVASRNALLQGLMGLGSSAIMASDERVKENIEPVGELPSGDTVYGYNYVWDDPSERTVGVMAQDIEKVDPAAVIEGEDGIKRVDYRRVIARALLEAA